MALRFISLALAFALVATVTFASGDSDDDSAAAAEKEYVTDPSTGKQVLKPQYGGTITYAMEAAGGFTHTDTFHMARGSSGRQWRCRGASHP